MSDFTIEQLEALKEGRTPGQWEWYWDQGIISLRGAGGEPIATDLTVADADMIAAAPALVDALIAEKRNHDDLRQQIGSLIGRLETRAENAHSNRSYTSAVAFRESARDLTRILDADNG